MWIVVPKGRCHAVSAGNAGHGGIAAHIVVAIIVRGSSSGRIVGTSVRITSGRHFAIYCEMPRTSNTVMIISEKEKHHGEHCRNLAGTS